MPGSLIFYMRWSLIFVLVLLLLIYWIADPNALDKLLCVTVRYYYSIMVKMFNPALFATFRSSYPQVQLVYPWNIRKKVLKFDCSKLVHS
ncbi:Uncharacterized protein TCM_014623 [Theobroma cacao]|uniref:Uncharacterized protein n=1 Tax=Theobroma cacao TaxID=3641 RepID=A0A061FY31_THECC|nr:Uncharacterized protein TCM_014623 [Theobroma cacao]